MNAQTDRRRSESQSEKFIWKVAGPVRGRNHCKGITTTFHSVCFARCLFNMPDTSNPPGGADGSDGGNGSDGSGGCNFTLTTWLRHWQSFTLRGYNCEAGKCRGFSFIVLESMQWKWNANYARLCGESGKREGGKWPPYVLINPERLTLIASRSQKCFRYKYWIQLFTAWGQWAWHATSPTPNQFTATSS